MTNKAYSYIRFSRPEQIKGNSLARQKEMSEQYCKENNLTLDTSLTLRDLGVSAFDGSNTEQGALGMFLKAIDNGKVAPGSYLLIESLDRLSRQTVATALRLFLNILDKGVTIVTLSDGMKYDHKKLDTHELIISITIMARAHDESAMKSKRLLAVNKSKRNNINQKKLTRMCPSWLTLNKDKTEFIQITDKVKTVQHIFELSASGFGFHSIVRELTERNIKPIGKSDKWHPSYISKILKGREVIGELSSNSVDGVAVYKDYYPAIISEELFYRVQNGIQSRNITGGGRKGKHITNIFQKLIFCGYSIDNNDSGYRCSGNKETIIISNKSGKKKEGHRYFLCSKVKRGDSGCTNCKKMWRHDKFETSFFSFISEIDISSLVGTTDELKKRISQLESLLVTNNEKLKHVRKQIKKITDAMLNTGNEIPDFLIKQGNLLEKEEQAILETIKANTTDLKSAQYDYNQSGGTKERLAQLISVMPTLNEEDLHELRQQLSGLLKEVIDRIEIYPCGLMITDEFISQIRKTQGIKAANILKKNREQTKNTPLPYFIVYFKSGSYRRVATDPSDPTRLIISITPETAESMLLGNIFPPE